MFLKNSIINLKQDVGTQSIRDTLPLDLCIMNLHEFLLLNRHSCAVINRDLNLN